jgi:hypothetical protein
MCDRYNEMYVSHTFAPYLFFGNFNAAPVTYDTFVTYALVFSAVTLVVSDGTEDALTEQPVALRLVGAVIDGFGLLYFASGMFEDILRRG